MRGADPLLVMMLLPPTLMIVAAAAAAAAAIENDHRSETPPLAQLLDHESTMLRGGYTLKQRQRPPPRRRKTLEAVMTLDQLIAVRPLSFSEDTAPVELKNFHLVLYETNRGDLPVSPSVETVETALATFLQAELNVWFNRNHQVETVQAALVQQSATATRQNGVTIAGTQIEMAVDVLFAYQPEPKYEQVESALQSIFLNSDLSHLVGNVTKLANATADEFLQEIHTIEYRGQIPVIVSEPPPEEPETNDEVNDNTSNDSTIVGISTEEQSKDFFGSVRFLVPILLASALILIGLILFVVPRRRKSAEESDESPSKQQQDSLSSKRFLAPLSEIASNDGTGINLYYDEISPSNDAYSLNGAEGMVEDIPLTPPSYRKAAASVTPVVDDSQSDIFSGIGGVSSNMSRNNNKSPRSPHHHNSDSRSVFSFLSNLGSKSTIVASNVTTNNKDNQRHSGGGGPNSPANSSMARRNGAVSSRSGSGTPRSRMSSLFTFSEEESEDNANETTKADQKLGISPSSVDEEAGAPFDEVKIVASAAASTGGNKPTTTTTTSNATTKASDSPKRHSSPLAAMAAGALSFVTGKRATRSNSGGGPTTPDRKNSPSTSAAMAMMAGTREGPTTPAPDDEMTSLTIDDITKDIKKAEEEFLMIKKATGFPPDTNDDEEVSRLSQPNKFSACDNACGPNACGPDYPMAITDSSASIDVVGVNRKSHSASPRRNSRPLSPQETVNGSLELVDPSTPLLTSTPTKVNLTIDTGSGKATTTRAGLSDPSPSVKSYDGVSLVATSSPARSDKSNKTEPGPSAQRSAHPSSESKNFMKLFFKSPKREAAKKAFAATTGDESERLLGEGDEARDEGESINNNRRRSMGSPGLKDGTGDYQHLTSEHQSPASSTNNSLSFRRGSGKPMAPVVSSTFVGSLQDNEEEWISPSGRVRKHTKSTAADGTSNYQNQYMRQYSTEGLDMADDPTLDDSFNGAASRKRRMMQIRTNDQDEGLAPMENNGLEALTPKSHGTTFSSVSGLSGNSPMTTKSPESSGKQLINDLIWLEQKIGRPKQQSAVTTAQQRSVVPVLPGRKDMIEHNDSLSFTSGDGKISTVNSTSDRNDVTLPHNVVVDNDSAEVIVCRDCIAPPGKLKIVIHSTKDGPAVHTVKKGSVLTGHMFPGDLIISVDNVDTRSYSAEQVMKLMTAKNRQQRKITVLHIESSAMT
jgi:hypothetical protein